MGPVAALFIRGVGRNGACNIDGAGMKYSRCQPPRHILRAGSIPAPELRSGVKVEVSVLGSPSLISLMVYVDVKPH